MEQKFQPIWDSFAVGETAISAATKIKLFKNPNGQAGAVAGGASAYTKADFDTNLNVAGVTEANQRLVVSAICPGLKNSDATYLKSIFEDGEAYLEFKINSKPVFKCPMFRLSSGWGIGEANSLSGNTVKDAYNLLPYPITIEPNSTFEVEIIFNAATTALGTGKETKVFVFLETVEERI